MTIPGSANPLLLASAAGSPAPSYQIERSLRFNSSDSAYLSRTPSVAGNRKTWTWAAWVKRSGTTTGWLPLFQAYDGSSLVESNFLQLTIYLDQIGIATNTVWLRRTQAVYRDYSAWMHVVCAFDTTQATGSDRVKIYVNGSQVTAFAASSDPTQNADYGINRAVAHQIGQRYGGQYFDGYLADVHFIDGQALDPTSFGEFDANGVWQPKAYTGSYPGNSFHLDFADNSAATTAGIGKDVSGNGNDWTPVNLSVAAGAGNDSLVDTPTNYGTDTGAGGEVRGNYCTLNPLAVTSTGGGTFSQGNLRYVGPNVWRTTRGTFNYPSSGKWYYEAVLTGTQFNIYSAAGFGVSSQFSAWDYLSSHQVTVIDNGTLYEAGSNSGSIFTPASNGVLGVAVDIDANTYQLYWQGVLKASSAIPFPAGTPLAPSATCYSELYGVWEYNFGQRPFAYPAPSGFKALCTTNLPAPVVAKPSEVMDVKLYTGNGSTQTISGLGFSPDLAWIKQRNAVRSHRLFDVIRGAGDALYSDLTSASQSEANALTAFNSTGFSLGDALAVNGSSNTYVAWTWDAGSSTVTNTQGSITSQVRANPSAGFSIVTYTGTGANATVGHGLNASPGLIIVKCRNAARNWNIYSAALGADKYLQFTTAAAVTDNTLWNNTPPTSTVFSLGTSLGVNGSTETHVAYCFAPVAGYSAFGSYTGNGSADGPFVYTGFRPRWVMIKASSAAGPHWMLFDTARSAYNLSDYQLYANLSNAEDTANSALDILSNGFKCRADTFNNINGNAVTYIYAAFAESSFAYSRAR